MNDSTNIVKVDHAENLPVTTDHAENLPAVRDETANYAELLAATPQAIAGDIDAVSLYTVMCRTLLEPGLSRRNVEERILKNVAMFSGGAVKKVARELFDGSTLTRRKGADGVTTHRLSSAADTKSGAIALLHVWAELTLDSLQKASAKARQRARNTQEPVALVAE